MGNRKHSKIDKLPEEQKNTVEQMLLAGSTYSEIVDYLKSEGVGISLSAICRYAKNYNANVQMLNIAQENFRRMQEEMEKYPDLDTTEAILRLASQNIFNALAQTDEKAWEEIEPEQMLKQATGLVRAAAHKKRIDVQTESVRETALEEMKGIVFAAMKQKRPELYADVVKFLNGEKKE